jgi:hypothetical protein
MKQRRIVAVLTIIAITGAASVSNSLAMAWRLDVSDRHVVDRGGLAGDLLIYTQVASGVPLDVQAEYDYIWPEQHGLRQSDKSRDGMDGKSGSLNDEGQYHPNPSERESAGSLNSPFSGFLYKGIPSADPMIEDLSRAPR